MKSFIILSASLLLALQCNAQQFILTGKLTGESSSPIILSYIDNTGKPVKDSVVVQNGVFVFKGNINGPTMASLTVSHRPAYQKNGKPNYKELFLEPHTIKLSGDYSDLASAKITGSKTHDDYLVLQEMGKPSNARMDSVENKWLAYNDNYITFNKLHEDHKRDSIGKIMDSLNSILVNNTKQMMSKFMTENPGSYVSAYELEAFKTRWSVKEVTALYAKLDPKIQQSYYGMKVKSVLDGVSENSAGKPAKDFTSIDYMGRSISLSGLKDKYVLLDFWGSWCAPCRAAVPHLKQLYTKYHNKGFEVLAVAVDDAQADWDAAIKKDGTNLWYNIMQPSRREGNTNNVKLISDAYQIHVYPSKILVKDGTIIGRYDGTDSTAILDKKLAEIFGK